MAQYATEYISARSCGVLAALVGFVATGTYRGFKVRRGCGGKGVIARRKDVV